MKVFCENQVAIWNVQLRVASVLFVKELFAIYPLYHQNF